jgi:hypothetical protein
MSNTTGAIPWYATHSELVSFADIMVEMGELQGPEDVVEFFRKPWHYDDEYAAWVDNGSPSDFGAPGWEAWGHWLEEQAGLP